MLIAPNPVKGGIISMSCKNMTPGEYTLTVVDNIGRSIVVKRIQVNGDDIVQTISLPSVARHGMYYVRLKAGELVISKCIQVN